MATAYLPDLTTTNLSFETIPIVWLISIAPRFWSRRVYKKAVNKSMDVHHPREFSKTIANDKTLDARTQGQLLRAEAAVANGFDNIGLFAAAIVAGNAAGLDVKLLNGLTLGYALSRVLYNFVYIMNHAPGRLFAYFSGLGMVMALFIKAGHNFKEARI